LEIPSHVHGLQGSNALLPGGSKYLTGLLLELFTYLKGTSNVLFAESSISSTGGNVAHDNMHPFLALGTVLYCSETCSTNLLGGSDCWCELLQGQCNVTVDVPEILTSSSVVASNLIMASNGSLVVDVFASAQLTVVKNATLGGTLTIQVTQVPPPTGQTFVVLRATHVHGQFQSVVFEPLFTARRSTIGSASCTPTLVGSTVTYQTSLVSVLLVSPPTPSGCSTSSSSSSASQGDFSSSSLDYALILGLSLGIGVPLVIAIVVVAVLANKRIRHRRVHNSAVALSRMDTERASAL